MKNKKIIKLLIIIGYLFICTSISNAADFPSSYQPYVEELQKEHPNWKFVALYTNLDWNYVIEKENEFGKNLVPKTYSDRWKNTTPRTI